MAPTYRAPPWTPSACWTGLTLPGVRNNVREDRNKDRATFDMMRCAPWEMKGVEKWDWVGRRIELLDDA
jgi:hypothetical protein